MAVGETNDCVTRVVDVPLLGNPIVSRKIWRSANDHAVDGSEISENVLHFFACHVFAKRFHTDVVEHLTFDISSTYCSRNR